jgi:hypothetical protein
MSAWLATALADDRATALADGLFATYAPLLRDDHDRWKNELEMPSPEESIAALRAHIAARPSPLLGQLAAYTGEALRKMTVRVVPARAGAVTIEQLPLTDDERSFTAFAGAPMRFSAQASAGYEFIGWQGTDQKGASIVVEPGKAKNLRAVFKVAGSAE